MTEVKFSDSLNNIQVTGGGEVRSEFPEFCGLWLPSANHSTLWNKLYHSSKIWDPTELQVCVYVSMLL